MIRGRTFLKIAGGAAASMLAFGQVTNSDVPWEGREPVG